MIRINTPYWMLWGIVLAGSLVSSAAAQNLPTSPSEPPLTPSPRPKLPFHPPGGEKTADQLVRLHSVSEFDQIMPGQTFHLAFMFDIEPGWHIYWKNPGASGAPTEITLSAPPGFQVGRTLFPRPTSFEGEEGTTYGYERNVTLLVEVTAPPTLQSSRVMFNAEVTWLVCKDICLMGRKSEIISLSTISSVREQSESRSNSSVAAARKRIPQPLDEVDGGSADFDGKTLTIRMPAKHHRTAVFFPIETPGVQYGSPEIEVLNDRVEITVSVEVNPGNALGKPMTVAGLVGLGDSADDPSFEFAIPLS